MGEVVVKKENAVVNESVIMQYLDTFTGTDALLPVEKKQFLQIAMAFNLNPFKREIYAVAYGKGDYRKLSIITGYEVYLKRAERTGLLNGWQVWIEGAGEDLRAVIEIHRKDWGNPFRHEAYYQEVVQRKSDGSVTSMWAKMPRFMLKKVAVEQGMRLCFPDELGGMPYAGDELGIDEPRNVTPAEYNFNSGTGNDASNVGEGQAPAPTPPLAPQFPQQKPVLICPVCHQKAVFESKFKAGTYYCFDKKGGCGAKFGSLAEVIGDVRNMKATPSEAPSDTHDFDDDIIF